MYRQPLDTITQEAIFSLSDKEGAQYRIALSPCSVESSSCSHSTAEGRAPNIFTLTLHCEQRSKILQKDSVLYRSRNRPYDYGIYRIYVVENNIAVFLDSGRFVVRLAADSSTYDQKRNGDSYHKLVIMDTRQTEPVVRALVLPPNGPFYDYPYYIHDVHDGEKKLVLLTGKNYLISDPMTPQEIVHKVDFNTND